MIFITRRAETSYSLSSRYQPPTSITCSISRSASSLVGFLTKEVVERDAQRLGVLAHRRVDGALLELDLLDVELLRHPEIEKGDPAVGHQDVVARMRVGVEVLQVDRAEAEAEHDLAEAAALLVPELLDLVEPSPRRTR